MINESKYGPLHAILAGAVLLYIPFTNGLDAFLQNFLHGTSKPLSWKMMLGSLVATIFLFGGIAFLAWVSTLFTRNKNGVSTTERKIPLPQALKLTLKSFPFIIVLALILSSVGQWTLSLFGIKNPEQQTVKWLIDASTPLSAKIILSLMIVFEAPLVEEPLFRGVIFRGFAKVMPIWAAVAVSGAIFAFVHTNASSLVALWYVGAAFAWLYYRTGTILAPMLAHLLFNLLNLIGLFICFKLGLT